MHSVLARLSVAVTALAVEVLCVLGLSVAGLSVAGLSVVGLSYVGAAGAQPYPARPVRLVIPFPPAGPADIFGRLLAFKLSDAFGEQVVVDNRGGGNGNVGADLVARAAPDGYTLLLLPSALAANASLYSKLPYSLVGDFTGVASLGTFALMLVTHPSVPARTLPELIALAKAKPGELNFASAGS